MDKVLKRIIRRWGGGERPRARPRAQSEPTAPAAAPRSDFAADFYEYGVRRNERRAARPRSMSEGMAMRQLRSVGVQREGKARRAAASRRMPSVHARRAIEQPVGSPRLNMQDYQDRVRRAQVRDCWGWTGEGGTNWASGGGSGAPGTLRQDIG